MIKTYETLADLLIDMMPFYCIPFMILTLRSIFKIVSEIAGGTIIAEGKRKEKLKNYDRIIERLEKDETRISIDEDLQKYFNYKE